MFKESLNKIKNLITENKYFSIMIAIALGIAMIFVYFIFTQPLTSWDTQVEHIGPRNVRALDGKRVAQEFANLTPVAIILENHVDSRPIAGLDQASVIYEIIVEGDITRFLAIFDGSFESSKVGPVRSVRPFFVEIAEEYNAVLFHAGGSPEGLDLVKKSLITNINEISGDGIYFWRDGTRGAPHNLFTSTNLIARAFVTKGLNTTTDFVAWKFKEDSPSEAQSEDSDFIVDFSSNKNYQVEYEYNQQANDYTRHLGGALHKTNQGIILKAKNVIVQKIDYEVIDDYGRLKIDLASGGAMTLHQDGKKIDGIWKKENGRTKFYDLSENEISFNRGTIWVELVFN